MRSFVLLFGLASLLFLQACQRKAVPTVSLPAAPKTIDIEEIDFGYMHGKARMVFRDDKREREVKANIRIRKDSVIWMTFSVVGVQGGKALINKDSITVVSNVDKEYFVFDYKELSTRFNFEINYNVLEAAMLGNLVRAKQTTDEIGREGEFDVLMQHENSVSIKSLINPIIRKIEKVELVESSTNNKLMLEYANFQPLGEKNLAYNGVVSVFYKTAAGLINNTITFEYNKIEIGDKELKFPFNIPKRYDRR
jgi:opacity protein-like surface antigen